MSEHDVSPNLKCDVAMEFSGPNDATLNKWAADVLRRLADSFDRNGLEDGYHDLRDNVGKPIGTVYIDYFGKF